MTIRLVWFLGASSFRRFDKLSDRTLNDYKPEISSSVTEVSSATVSPVTGSRRWLSLSKPSSGLFRHFGKLSDRKLSDPLIDDLDSAR